MCFKKIAEWFKPEPIVPVEGVRVALLFGINDYSGSANDLNGCLNDIDDTESKLISLYPDFKVRKFKDDEVTRSRFIAELDAAISVLQPGNILYIGYSGHGTQVTDRHADEEDGYDEALYLYDGALIDDEIGDSLQKIPEGATVVLAFDSCFSGTVTRMINDNTNRFHKIPGQKASRNLIKGFAKNDMKWVVFSGCMENETSADAYISGQYNGAFTYYFLKTLQPGITYRDWIERLNRYLPGGSFDQTPTLEGKKELLDKVVFI